jgi:hypothetical protein
MQLIFNKHITYVEREFHACRIILCSQNFKYPFPSYIHLIKLNIGYDYGSNNVAPNILYIRLSSKRYIRSSIYDAANVTVSRLLSRIYRKNFRLVYGGTETSCSKSHVLWQVPQQFFQHIYKAAK